MTRDMGKSPTVSGKFLKQIYSYALSGTFGSTFRRCIGGGRGSEGGGDETCLGGTNDGGDVVEGGFADALHTLEMTDELFGGLLADALYAVELADHL